MKTLFRNFIELHRGYDLPKNKRISGDFPIVSSTGIVGKHNSYKVKGPGVITGRSGTIGKVIFEKGCFWPLNTTLFVSDFKGNDPKYVYYWLQCFDLKHYTTGSTVPTLNRNDLSNLIIDVPTINEQRKRREILEILDAKIATNIEISQQLESMAKTIYDYWFLQFEFPDKDGKPYKSNGGKMIWNKQLKRKIPEGWEVKSIFECADVQYGKPLSTKLFSKNGIPVIRIRDIDTLSNSAYTQENIENKYLSKSGDLLIGMDGNFQMNFWPRNNDCVNQRIVRIRKGIIPLLLIKFQIKPYIDRKVSSVARSTVGHLKDNDIKELKILLPSTDQLDLTIFDTFLQKIITIENESQQLKSLRNFLLPMLMNGQVSISD